MTTSRSDIDHAALILQARELCGCDDCGSVTDSEWIVRGCPVAAAVYTQLCDDARAAADAKPAAPERVWRRLDIAYNRHWQWTMRADSVEGPGVVYWASPSRGWRAIGADYHGDDLHAAMAGAERLLGVTARRPEGET